MKNGIAFLGRDSGTLLQGILGYLLAIPFLALFVCMFLGPPIAVLWESIDLVRMQEMTSGKILDVTYESGKMSDRARITYTFSVAGQQFISNRYLPGFAGNNSTWTGGAAVGDSFPVGRQVLVHYSAADPSLCALEYGWFIWSAAPTFMWMGLAAIAFAAFRMQPSRGASCLRCIGIALTVLGFCEIFVGSSVIRVRELHWHCLAWCATLGGIMMYIWGERRFALPATSADGLPPNIESPDRSTSSLVLELLCGLTILAWMIAPMRSGIPFFWSLVRVFGDGITDFSRILEKFVELSFLLVIIAVPLCLTCAVVAFFQKVLRRVAWHLANPKV